MEGPARQGGKPPGFAGKTLFGSVVAIPTEGGVIYAHEGCWWKNRPKRLPVQQAFGEVG